jgi:hypothetical protein
MQKQHKALLLALRDGKIDTSILDQIAAKAAGDPSKMPKLPDFPPGVDPMRDTMQIVLPPEFYEDLDLYVAGGDGVIIEDFPPPEKPVPLRAKPSAQQPVAPVQPPVAPVQPPVAPSPPVATPPAAQQAPVPVMAVPKSAQSPAIKIAPPPAPPKFSPKVTQHASPPPPPPAGRKGLQTPASAARAQAAAVPPPPPKKAPAPPLPPPVPPPAPLPIQAARAPEVSDSRSKPPPKKAPGASKFSSAPPPDPKRPRIFAEVARPSHGMGEDQLGERSLDEVILSYLADDLQDD